MRRLLGFTLIGILACFTLTGTALIVGRDQPLPERLAMLHLTDCAPPCWIGITPGVTTVRDAIKRVDAVYTLKNTFSPAGWMRILFSQDPNSWITLDYASNDVIQSIEFAFRENHEIAIGDAAQI